MSTQENYLIIRLVQKVQAETGLDRNVVAELIAAALDHCAVIGAVSALVNEMATWEAAMAPEGDKPW